MKTTTYVPGLDIPAPPAPDAAGTRRRTTAADMRQHQGQEPAD